MARVKFLPFAAPSIGEDEIAELIGVLSSDWISTGPLTKKFEQEFGEYIGAKHAAAVNSCTAGLHLSLLAAGIGPGDEVVTSTFTFCSTANVIVHAGARPVLVDIDRDTRNLDPRRVKEAITDKTRAIIPVHYGGHPCDMESLLQIAKENDLLVVEDAAHGIGAEYQGRKVGNLGDIASFSFYATKNITTGEGGMVTTSDDCLAEKVRVMSLHGISHDAWHRYEMLGSWYYEVLCPGFKYNMTDVQAALGIHQLRKITDFLARRDYLAQLFHEKLSKIPVVEIPTVRPGVKHAWHLYTILLKDGLLDCDRAEFIKELTAEGIGTSVHFIPVHLHPYYQQEWGFKKGDFPVAEDVYERLISLPLYPKMTDTDAEDVIDAVRTVAERHSV